MLAPNSHFIIEPLNSIKWNHWKCTIDLKAEKLNGR